MNKQEQEAFDADLVIIRKADESFGKNYKEYNLYQFKVCGHTQHIGKCKVKIKQFQCRQCIETKIKTEAENAGLTFISKSDRNDLTFGKVYRKYNLYTLNSCGHTTYIHVQQVRDKSFTCQECKINTQKNEADISGLVYIDKTQSSFGKNYRDYNLYRFKECNHTQDIRIFEVRHNIFECRECKERRHNRPSNVYVYKITSPDLQWLKLGFAHDLEFRKSRYDLPPDCTVELLFSKPTLTGQKARSIEQSVHDKFKASKLNRDLMLNYMRKSGFTECYPLHLLDDILKELNEQYCIQSS